MLRLTLLAYLSVLALPVSAQQVPGGSQGETVDLQKADVDEMTNIAVRMASDSQAYYLKPHDFGGGEGSFDGISLAAIEYSVDGSGRHVRQSSDGKGRQAFTLVQSDAGVTIRAFSDRSDQIVWVTVFGPTLEDLAVRVTTL